jgi:hypothetical protein
MNEKKAYDAVLFRQRPDAPLQAAFVAPSAEIDCWARVPTKRTGNIRNFQRAEIRQHVAEVTRFFENPSNASPTAVVVGFDPVRAEGRLRVVGSDGKPVTTETLRSGGVSRGVIEIGWVRHPDATTPSDVAAAIVERRSLISGFIFGELADLTGLAQSTLTELETEFAERARLGRPSLSEVEDDVDDGEESDAQESEGMPEAEPDNSALEDLSGAARAALRGLSPSERQIVIGRLEFLAQLQESVLTAAGAEQLAATLTEVQDETKPGILIDGQHRVIGTKKLGEIPFLVCALPDAKWPELAFQFLVTNRTAKRVQESLLINIVGNSLSKEQRAAIEERLRDSGIRVGLIEAVMKVSEDESSPFYGMLAFGIKNERGFLDAAAMRSKVIKLWYERKARVKDLFDHFCEGRRQVDRTDYWKSEELWFSFFIAFWNAIKSRYDGSAVFSTELADLNKKTPASKLMTATVLGVFQVTVLENLHRYLRQKQQKDGVAIADSLKNAAAFAELVGNALKPLTPDFFVGWEITGFDGSKGAREDLSAAIETVISGEMTVSKLKQTPAGRGHRLFKAPRPSR